MKAVLVLLVFFLAFEVSAKSPKACINVFTVAISGFWPISFFDKNGQLTGIGHDLASELQERTGCELRVESQSPFANWKALVKGKADVILFNIEDSSPNASYGEFVPLMRTRRLLIVRKEIYRKDWSIQKYIDAPKVRLAGVIGMRFAYKEGEVETLRKQHLYIETTTHENLLDLLMRNGADATFFVESAFDFYQKNNPTKDRLVKIPDPDTWLSVGSYISKKTLNASDRAMLKMRLEEIRNDGTFERLLQKYFKPDTVRAILGND